MCADKQIWFLLFPKVQFVKKKCIKEELSQASVQQKAAANKGCEDDQHIVLIYLFSFSLPFFSSSKMKKMILMVFSTQTLISVILPFFFFSFHRLWL